MDYGGNGAYFSSDNRRTRGVSMTAGLGSGVWRGGTWSVVGASLSTPSVLFPAGVKLSFPEGNLGRQNGAQMGNGTRVALGRGKGWAVVGNWRREINERRVGI